jgi:hypothetical protein
MRASLGDRFLVTMFHGVLMAFMLSVRARSEI